MKKAFYLVGGVHVVPVHVVDANRVVIVIAVADPLKENAASTISALHQAGLRAAMITGDAQKTAEAVAKKLGINDAPMLAAGAMSALSLFVLGNALRLRRSAA